MGRPRYSIFRIALVIAALAVSGVPASSLAANPGAKIAAQLAAGEFGPALQSARAIQEPALRDKWLKDVAAAQAAAGAPNAALATAADIASDLTRKSALGSVAASRLHGGSSQRGARGGGAFADFDSL